MGTTSLFEPSIFQRNFFHIHRSTTTFLLQSIDSRSLLVTAWPFAEAHGTRSFVLPFFSQLSVQVALGLQCVG